MAVTQTPRLGLNRWSAGTDAWPGRAGWDQQQQTLDEMLAIDLQVATVDARPTAGVTGRYCFVTGTGRLYRDDGTQWSEVNPIGGAGAGGALAYGGAGVEGTSARIARADHTHTMPAHDAAAHSAIPLSALAPPTANVNMNSRRITSLAAPTVGSDAATRAWVESFFDAHFAAGSDSIGTASATSSPVSKSVAFGKTFAQSPVVILQKRGLPGSMVELKVNGATSTGFNVTADAMDGGSWSGTFSFGWIATDIY
ncbi:hypothetical protein [Jiangella muralis]|uniref:hypothetical protein n=1 Tax=Jiangella muralis TaxID=702383 RepID=UPI00069F2AAE|nr:hypothetical protein [Jiangella muralis]